MDKRIICHIVDSLKEEGGVGSEYLPYYREGREWFCSALAAQAGTRWERHCLKRGFERCMAYNRYHENTGFAHDSPAYKALKGFYYLQRYVLGAGYGDPEENLQEGLLERFGHSDMPRN